MDFLDLAGKTALVTGGARRLGRAITLSLAEAGCDLAIHYFASLEMGLETAAQVQAMGRRGVLIPADLSSAEGVEQLFRAYDQAFERLDVLVNSAAILEPIGLLDAGEADWERTIGLNLKAPFFCLQQAARRMRQGNGGAIINISDVAGLRPWSRYPIHSISKAGVEMLTRVAALMLAPDVRVNAVAPGPVLKPEGMDEQRWLRLGEGLPAGRTGSPGDVAQAVLFLLANDFVTGETVVVDGGDQLR